MAVCQKGHLNGALTDVEDSLVQKQRLACVKLLIKNKRDIDSKGQSVDVNYIQPEVGMTALHWAAFNNDIVVCQYLITEGKAKSVLNKRDLAPVDIAAFCDHWKLVKAFCSNYNDRVKLQLTPEQLKEFGIEGLEHKETRLSKVAEGKNENLHKQLLKKIGQKPEIEVDEFTEGSDEIIDARIVYWACGRGDIKTVRHAIRFQKMSPSIKCYKKRSFFSAAMEGGHQEVLEYLLSFKYRVAGKPADYVENSILDQGNQGNTPLHFGY